MNIVEELKKVRALKQKVSEAMAIVDTLDTDNPDAKMHLRKNLEVSYEKVLDSEIALEDVYRDHN